MRSGLLLFAQWTKIAKLATALTGAMLGSRLKPYLQDLVMLIHDLSYLEDLSEAKAISGSGALVNVAADASATGASTLTLTDTTTRAKELKNGLSIAFGRGEAIATGDDPMAIVSVYGEGDKVIEKTKTHYKKNFNTMISKGFVIVIDRP